MTFRCNNRAIVQQLVAQIPWNHNCVLLDRVKAQLPDERELKKVMSQVEGRVKRGRER